MKGRSGLKKEQLEVIRIKWMPTAGELVARDPQLPKKIRRGLEGKYGVSLKPGEEVRKVFVHGVLLDAGVDPRHWTLLDKSLLEAAVPGVVAERGVGINKLDEAEGIFTLRKKP